MPWLMAGLVILLVAGFAKLTAIVVNRLLAAPHPKLFIGSTELIQAILIAIYAGFVIRGIRHYGLAVIPLTNSFPVNPVPCQILSSVGVIGFLLLIRSAIGFQAYRPPACQTANDSRNLDFRQTLGSSWRDSLVGPRPMRTIALLPANQQFTVEISTKHFSLPRLPENWDGISIVHLSDTHFRGAVTRTYFEMVCQKALELQPALFVFTGDLLDDISLIDWLPETFGQLKAQIGQYFILGNHDWYLDPPSIRAAFLRAGWTDATNQPICLQSSKAGPPLIIAGDETPWMGDHPIFPTESTDGFRILLSHTPDNIEWARNHHVDLMLSGHTHGGQIRLPLIGPVYSPSRYGCRFASGVFWLDSTLLCVSRGLSGREPVRYFCPPELTKLVLHRAPGTQRP